MTKGYTVSMNKSIETKSHREMNFAMRLSFVVGLFMLLIKTYAYYITDSIAILSDAAESVIHVFAVGFAAYSMWFSLKPADSNHLYGHEKISYFSAGFEGGMITIAALYIYYEAIHKIIYGFELQNIGIGMIFIIAAVIINFSLGWYLVKKGKKFKSIILEADGKHILTDCLTSSGVILALALVKLTGISLLDPIVAILAATNILWTGVKLLIKSIKGLMDQTDPALHRKITTILDRETCSRKLDYHRLRHRTSGSRVFIEFHLLFPNDINLGTAHDIASEIEARLQSALDTPSEINTHLEPKLHHDHIHEKYGLPI